MANIKKALCIGVSSVALMLASAVAEANYYNNDDDTAATADINDIRNSSSSRDSTSLDRNRDVNASVLEATVSNNTTNIELKDDTYLDGNLIKDHVQQYADGINQNLQNTGMNSSSQQSVTVHATINNSMGGSTGGGYHH